MVETRSIRADYAAMSCDVCGRTLLRGEQPDAFLAGGVRRQVCELCIPRAQHEGWIREAGMDELGVGGARQEGRGRGWLDRLRAHRERAREQAAEVAASDAAPEPSSRRREPASEPAAVPAGQRAENRQPRHVRAVPTNAELKMQRAIDLFNVSEFPRTVSGVARSLGAPDVCVRPLADRPSVVTITVMWELSWYRFEVDLSDEAGGLRREASGYELDELDEAERRSNAQADAQGVLALGPA
ncbi:MAG: hypothetical protein AVDCRST_MAG38-2648 [uncultured Solirubrobacteraceae bacterium]|uniref:Uncharacterized protein n=1 Tax=uncultured Solirubrobacteraceae bacterium TaxID=1162706 RepID=A0A6J4SFY6_9ACTN|nr:MAG: hypothetical protein AVDCRST_MAG38-2648 [uncultured Solirubrobacteraceae bacterium]